MDEEPYDLRMCALCKGSAGFAELQPLKLYFTDKKLFPTECVEVDSNRDEIPARLVRGKG